VCLLFLCHLFGVLELVVDTVLLTVHICFAIENRAAESRQRSPLLAASYCSLGIITSVLLRISLLQGEVPVFGSCHIYVLMYYLSVSGTYPGHETRSTTNPFIHTKMTSNSYPLEHALRGNERPSIPRLLASISIQSSTA
jgi:hypothetical protein